MSEPVNLPRLQQLLDAATPGPWTAANDNNIAACVYQGDAGNGAPFDICWQEMDGPEGEANAALIAELVSAAPALLAELERLTAENERLRRAGHCDRERHIDPVHVACAECQGWDLQGLPRASNHARTCSRYDDHGDADYRALAAAEARLAQLTEAAEGTENQWRLKIARELEDAREDADWTVRHVIDQCIGIAQFGAASVIPETGEKP